MIKRYRVIGDRAYREHEPGEVFPAALTADEEERALGRGAIEIVGSEPTVAERRLAAGTAGPIPRPRVGLGSPEKSSYEHGGGV